jgi:hypothetical protein
MPFVLTIRERNHSWAGRPPASSQHKTLADARAELVDYVRRNWDSEIGTERPDEPNQMVEDYFSEVLEAYEIQEV